MSFLLVVTCKDNDAPTLNYEAGKRKCGSKDVYPRYQREKNGQVYVPAGVPSGITFLVPTGQELAESEPDWTQWQR
jgi:hypothetical protein